MTDHSALLEGYYSVFTATGAGFRVLSLDVHTVHEGRIASTVHVEDWAGAMAQLAAR